MTTAPDMTVRSGLRTSSLADWLPFVSAHAGNHTVAVVLPARDEAATVGDIVAAIATEFGRGRRPLVDDIVVVDSGSTDGTAAIAATAGARVVGAQRPGKGEAMWQGLAATTADLVVFLDADLEHFDARFVPALLGPLLADPAVEFVKAAYDRPVDQAGTAGGGRVTELMARPLLAAFWPELAGLAQPLSGEYAARRPLLERLPFRCGYGVDIGLLVDAWHDAGLDGIAQVDLYERHHSHSDLAALGRMAAEVLHTVIDRLTAEGRLPVDLDPSPLLWQPLRGAGGIELATYEVDVGERPPLRLHREVARLSVCP